ncbi:hypothetical protein MRX96_013543 [Rhipicephalus microplus]
MNAISAEQSGDEVAREDVAELERWKQEQMKKGVSTARDRQNLSSQAVLERITDRLATVHEMLAVHRRQKTQALTDLEVVGGDHYTAAPGAVLS